MRDWHSQTKSKNVDQEIIKIDNTSNVNLITIEQYQHWKKKQQRKNIVILIINKKNKNISNNSNNNNNNNK